jgi:hypothetical protein
MSGILVINDSFEILTPTGWQNFLGIKRSVKKTVVVKFNDESIFACTADHEIKVNGNFITVGSLKPRNIVYGKSVVSICLNHDEFVYDPIEVSNGNQYYSEEIINHNCNFLGSSLTLIDADAIARMSSSPIILSKDGLDIYEKPVRELKIDGVTKSVGHSYVIVADTAKGVGGDYSAFTIIDITGAPYKVVGKYRNNKISPMLYPSVIHKIAREYNDAYVLVEINSSEQVAIILHEEYEYENILFVNRNSNGQVVSAGFGGGKTQLGVITDKKIKRIGCTTFKALVEENKLLIPDADIISEISTFIETKNTYRADDGYNDDLVMTLVLFGWLSTNPYFKDLNNINIRQVIYENRIKMIEDEMTPFGFYNDGRGEEESSNWLN